MLVIGPPHDGPPNGTVTAGQVPVKPIADGLKS